MGKKILDSKALYIFLSIILAIAIWFYVTSQDGNQSTKSIRNIPVTFSGLDILEERGLMIVGTTPTASVEVKATPTVLAKLDDKTLTLTVNVSQITEASHYTLAYTASLPAGVAQDKVEFISGATGNVSFTVARYSSRNVEIRGRFAGTVADGYLAGDSDEFIFAPKTVKISGQSDLVNQVAYVLVTVDGTDLKETVTGEYPYQLIGVNGEPLEDLDVTCSDETIYVTYPILATAEVELKINFVTGGGISESDLRYTLSTDHITVAGTPEDIAALGSDPIVLGTVNLASVYDGDELRFEIPLADELTNLSGITEVTTTLKIVPKLVTAAFDAENISCINVPEGWRAEVVTKLLSVTVRGRESLVEQLSAENIRVVADLKDINAAAGRVTVTARIYLDSAGTAEQVGVTGTEYKVVVNLTKD